MKDHLPIKKKKKKIRVAYMQIILYNFHVYSQLFLLSS